MRGEDKCVGLEVTTCGWAAWCFRARAETNTDANCGTKWAKTNLTARKWTSTATYPSQIKRNAGNAKQDLVNLKIIAAESWGIWKGTIEEV
jgi:hypothetical protein